LALFAAPMTAQAQTAMVMIDVTTLGGADADNSADVATDSQWSYNDTNKFLWLFTANGNYTLTGSNGNLSITVDSTATNASITLNALSATLSSSSYNIQADCTVTLVGANTLAGGSNRTLSVWNNNSLTINGSGSLTAEGLASSNSNGIQIGAGSSLSITGSAAVTVIGGLLPAISDGGSTILIGDNASLTMASASPASTETHTFGLANPASTYQWKLTNATTTNPLTNASITVTRAAGATATVARGPRPTGGNTASVPVLSPVGLALLALALGGMAFWRRRKV
jgi:hypothetical protein